MRPGSPPNCFEEGFALFLRQVVDRHLSMRRERTGAPEQLFHRELEAFFSGSGRRIGRHRRNNRSPEALRTEERGDGAGYDTTDRYGSPERRGLCQKLCQLDPGTTSATSLTWSFLRRHADRA